MDNLRDFDIGRSSLCMALLPPRKTLKAPTSRLAANMMDTDVWPLLLIHNPYYIPDTRYQMLDTT